jgi:hypothetical protein
MNSAQLPDLLEYAKALGAPLVALVAASIAGWIGFRQWATARNKLKLDFFDRRMAIYTLAVEVIDWLADPDYEDASCISRLRDAATSARWLLEPSVEVYANYLVSTARRVRQIGKAADNEIYKDKDALREALRQRIQERKNRLAKLNELFDPYLSVKH